MASPNLLDRSFSEMVDEVIVATRNLVDREFSQSKKVPGWQEFLLVAMYSTQTIYGTIKYIGADKPGDPDRKLEYGLVISALNRQLVDLLFSIIFMRYRPKSRSMWFHRSGWREVQNALEILRTVRGSSSQWVNVINKWEANQEHLRRIYRISTKKARDPKAFRRWPLPGEIKGRTDIPKRTASFLTFLYDWYYKDLSQYSHLTGGGIIRMYSKLLLEEDKGRDRILKTMKWNNYLTATTISLAICTEVNSIGNFGRGNRLAYLWNILAENFAEANDLYERRYRRVLRC